MNNQENSVNKNWEGKFRVLKKKYKGITKKHDRDEILKYSYLCLLLIAGILIILLYSRNEELKKENMYLNSQNIELTSNLDMYFDTALYFADMSVAMDDTNASLKEVVSNQEEELMAYREREELYDDYFWALYYSGNRTDLTYYQIQSLQDYCDDKGYSSDMVDLVLAVAMKESHCNEDAMNESGATGYCQLLGSTARFVYKELQGHETYTHNDALDGEKNLKMAADYLYYLYDYHGNDPIKMIDSYRGMHSIEYINAIDNYLKKNDLSIYDISLERE